jgi:hypothetical protein
MGSTLFNTTPQNTYPSLIKIGDNLPLTSTLKRLSDGNGNDLPLLVSATGITNYGAGAITTNTVFGDQSLLSNTSGSNNTALGYRSLRANTSGSYNVGVGVDALLSNTTGTNNVAVGGLALTTNTTGGNNSAFGYSALRDNN